MLKTFEEIASKETAEKFLKEAETVIGAMESFAAHCVEALIQEYSISIHQKIEEFEKSEEHTGGGIPIADLFENEILNRIQNPK